MKRPMIYVVLYLLTGIMFGQCFPQWEGAVIFIALICFVTLLVGIKTKIAAVALLPIFSLIGFVIAFSTSFKQRSMHTVFESEDVVFVGGSVVSKGKEYDGKRKVIFKCSEVFDDSASENVDFNIYAYVDDKNVDVGNRVVLMGKLCKINPAMNESDRDMQSYYRARNIAYSMQVIKLTKTKVNKNAAYYISLLRNKFINVYDDILPVEEAGIMKAVMLGEKSAIDDDIYSDFQMAGVAHIVAVSGLHVGIFAAIVAFLTKRLGKIIPFLITLFAVWFYCVLTLCTASALRAVIMITIMLSARLIHRDYDIVSSACTAAVIILLILPESVFDAGFQYSFASVISIGLAYDLLVKYKIKNKLACAVSVSVAASIASKCISVFYNYTLNFFDIVANLLITGFMTIVFASGLVGGVLGLINIHIGRVAISPAFAFLKYFRLVCKVVTALPFTHYAIGAVSVGGIIFVYIFLFCVYNICMNTDRFSLYFAQAILICAVLSGSKRIYENDFDAEFLYIGQGDCSVINTAEKCCVVDGGDNRYSDFGRYTLLPFLYSKGVNRVNEVFVSHTDSDHAGGIEALLEYMPVDELYFSKCVTKNDEYYKLCTLAEKYGTNIGYIDVGDVVDIDEKTSMHCLYAGNGDSGNNNSDVLKLVHSGISVLYTGDIEADAERDIVEGGADLSADVLKVAHHGSATSSTEVFLKAVSPKAAIASAGINNIYSHPSKTTTERICNMGISFYATNVNGCVGIYETAGGLDIKTFIGEEYETN